MKVEDPRYGKSPFLATSGSRFIGVTVKLTSKARLGYRGFSLYATTTSSTTKVPIPARSRPPRATGPDHARAGHLRGAEVRHADGLRFHVDAPIGAEESIEIRLK